MISLGLIVVAALAVLTFAVVIAVVVIATASRGRLVVHVGRHAEPVGVVLQGFAEAELVAAFSGRGESEHGHPVAMPSFDRIE